MRLLENLELVNTKPVTLDLIEKILRRAGYDVKRPVQPNAEKVELVAYTPRGLPFLTIGELSDIVSIRVVCADEGKARRLLDAVRGNFISSGVTNDSNGSLKMPPQYVVSFRVAKETMLKLLGGILRYVSDCTHGLDPRLNGVRLAVTGIFHRLTDPLAKTIKRILQTKCPRFEVDGAEYNQSRAYDGFHIRVLDVENPRTAFGIGELSGGRYRGFIYVQLSVSDKQSPLNFDKFVSEVKKNKKTIFVKVPVFDNGKVIDFLFGSVDDARVVLTAAMKKALCTDT